MPSVDLQFVRNRHREIHRAIARSSPALLYSGTLGIVIVARNKKMIRPRIGKILDRLAIVSRGEITASNLMHEIAAAKAYTDAHSKSKGDVQGSDAVQEMSIKLSQCYHAFLGAPLAVESCLVHLGQTPDDDYMAHVGPEGSVQLFERIHFMGSVPERHTHHGAAHADTADDETTVPSESSAHEALKLVNERLNEQWQDHTSINDLLGDLGDTEELQTLFAPGKHRDIVLLSREAFLEKNYEQIFQRLTIR